MGRSSLPLVGHGSPRGAPTGDQPGEAIFPENSLIWGLFSREI